MMFDMQPVHLILKKNLMPCLQDQLQPATALKSQDFELPLPLASRSDLLASTFGERASSLHGLSRSGDAASTVYESANPRFKTEICRNFKEKGTCLYGDLCQFAHGKHELRGDVVRHAKYKTKPCQKYWVAGYCAYGPRCNFVHQVEEFFSLHIESWKM